VQSFGRIAKLDKIKVVNLILDSLRKKDLASLTNNEFMLAKHKFLNKAWY